MSGVADRICCRTYLPSLHLSRCLVFVHGMPGLRSSRAKSEFKPALSLQLAATGGTPSHRTRLQLKLKICGKLAHARGASFCPYPRRSPTLVHKYAVHDQRNRSASTCTPTRHAPFTCGHCLKFLSAPRARQNCLALVMPTQDLGPLGRILGPCLVAERRIWASRDSQLADRGLACLSKPLSLFGPACCTLPGCSKNIHIAGLCREQLSLQRPLASNCY